MNVLPLVDFIMERERVRMAKEAGKPKPWTDDPILQQYRFCNVRRNDDKQTRLIHEHWLHPHAGNPDAWFAMVVARLVNWWPTLEEAGYPVPWNHARFKKALAQRKDGGQKVFTGAYMVRADAVVSGSKADYLADYVLTPLWEARAKVRPRDGDTLEAFHARLMQFRDMGSFMAAQVVADVKYDPKGPLRRAADFMTWAAPGPGSLRGLNRVCGDPPDTPWNGHTPSRVWEDRFNDCLQLVALQLVTTSLHDLTAQDLQNCLCEFDKYERVRLGQGKPRSRYNGQP